VRRAPFPLQVSPQLATLVDAVPAGPDWLHETKWDGYRVIAFLRDGKATLRTRSGHDWTHRFPDVARALVQVPVRSAVVDGEVVVPGPGGRTSFQALQRAIDERATARVVLMAFDVLYLDGWDVRAAPLEARKRLLDGLLRAHRSRAIRRSPHVPDGAALFERACRRGLEGIVSKLRDAPYRSGRGREWRKVRCGARQEMVVVGWTPHARDSRAVGALLRYAGRVGTGFDEEDRRALRARLVRLSRAAPPVVDPPRSADDLNWVRPTLVAEVRFTEWTADGRLRHPVFLGLRADKSARDVRRE
jgi:bifunctional non-homologous end joining protein LigD